MIICLERGADLHMAQLMPLPHTVSCFSKIQIGFTFLLPAHPGSPGQRAVKRVCVCVCVCVYVGLAMLLLADSGELRSVALTGLSALGCRVDPSASNSRVAISSAESIGANSDVGQFSSSKQRADGRVWRAKYMTSY